MEVLMIVFSLWNIGDAPGEKTMTEDRFLFLAPDAIKNCNYMKYSLEENWRELEYDYQPEVKCFIQGSPDI